MPVTAGTLSLTSASNTGGIITVALSWLTATGGTGPYTYAIQRSGASGFVPFATYITGLSGLTESLTTPTYYLPPGSNYFRILATDSLGATGLSNILHVVVPQILVAPTLTVASVGANAKLTWTPATGGVNPPFTYDVQRSPNSNMSSATDLGDQTSPYTDTSPPAGVNYYQITVTDTNSPVVDTAYSNIAPYGAAPATLSETGFTNPLIDIQPVPTSPIYVTFFPQQNVSPRMLTEAFNIGGKIKLSTGSDIAPYFIVATCDVWGSSGNQVVTAAPMQATPWPAYKSINILYMLYTGKSGSGRPITVPDTYRAVYTVKMSDNSTTAFEQFIVIDPIPF